MRHLSIVRRRRSVAKISRQFAKHWRQNDELTEEQPDIWLWQHRLLYSVACGRAIKSFSLDRYWRSAKPHRCKPPEHTYIHTHTIDLSLYIWLCDKREVLLLLEVRHWSLCHFIHFIQVLMVPKQDAVRQWIKAKNRIVSRGHHNTALSQYSFCLWEWMYDQVVERCDCVDEETAAAIAVPPSGPCNAPWFSSETLALYKSLTYLLTECSDARVQGEERIQQVLSVGCNASDTLLVQSSIFNPGIEYWGSNNHSNNNNKGNVVKACQFSNRCALAWAMKDRVMRHSSISRLPPLNWTPTARIARVLVL